MDSTTKRLITRRLNDFVQRGESVLFEPQFQVIADIADSVTNGAEYGYIKRPTGTGKTVTFSALIDALNPKADVFDLPALIIAPRNLLTTQIKDTFTDPKFFNYDPSLIGIYNSDCSPQEQQDALKAPILVTTYPSAMNLIRKGKINPADYPLVMLDEVHRARGDNIRPFIQENIFGKSLVLGWTATDTFISGQTIGDYLFHGQQPMHVTTFRDAVEYGELVPVKNIIIETEAYGGVITSPSGKELTAKEKEDISQQTGRDEKALSMYANYRDPQTGAYFRDMNAVFYAAGKTHARKVAEKINAGFGEGYAVMVSGETPQKELEAIINDYRAGKIGALVNADLLIEGFDAHNAQLCFMLSPTRSPIVAEQTGGRVMRKDANNPDKMAYVITLVAPNMQGIATFGDVAGGYFIAPENYQMPSSSARSKRPAPTGDDWPDVKDITVIDTNERVIEFLKRKSDLIVPDKTDDDLGKFEFITKIGTSTVNPNFIALWKSIEDAYKADPKNPTVDGQRVECGIKKSGSVSPFCIDVSMVEWAKSKLGKDITQKANTDLGKAELITKIGTSNINPNFTALWQAMEDAYQADPENPIVDGQRIECGVKKSGSKSHFCVDVSMVEWAKSKLGKNIPEKTNTDLTKNDFATKIGIKFTNPEFLAFWEKIEDAYKANPKNPIVDDQRIECGVKKSSSTSPFCVDESMVEWAKSKLGKDNPEKASTDLTKGDFARKIGIDTINPEFTALWQSIEDAYKADPKNPTVDGQRIECGAKKAASKSPFCVNESMLEWARSKLGKDIPEKTNADLTKSDLATKIGIAYLNPDFTALWQSIEDAYKADPKNPIVDGQRIECVVKKAGNKSPLCVDVSMLEWARSKLGRDIPQKTSTDLTQSDFATKIGTAFKNPDFKALWQSIEDAYKADPENPTVDGQRIECGVSKSYRKSNFCVDESMVEWAKSKLGKESSYKPNPPTSAGESAEGKAKLRQEDLSRRKKRDDTEVG